MPWILLSALFDFGFAQLFKYGQRRGFFAPVVVTTNYLTLALSLTVYLSVTQQLTFSPDAIRSGLMTGVVFISSMSLMTRVLEIAPAGAVLTAFRLSIAIPVGLGVLLWQEPMSRLQLGGISLAILALYLMTPRQEQTGRFTGARAFGILMGVFTVQGLSNSCLRSVHYFGLDNEFLQVLTITGLTAGSIGACAVAFKRRRPTHSELGLGGLIGLYNALALCVILTALSRLPGTLFFPVMGCTVVLLDNLAAHFYWKEPLTRAAVSGVVLALLAITLVV